MMDGRAPCTYNDAAYPTQAPYQEEYLHLELMKGNFRTTSQSHLGASGYTGAPDASPRPPPHTKPPPGVRRRNTVRFWTWEILSVLLCLGLIAAIFSVLASFNGQRVPEWSFSINLSTLIALLATIFRATLVTIAAKVISQAKWSWFSSPGDRGIHPLRQLDAFDSASRTAWGAAYLIPTVIRRSPVTILSALIVIVSFATGPFVQQAIKTVECDQLVPGVKASIPIAHYVPGSSGYFRIGAGQWEMYNDMKGALIAGLSNPATISSTIAANCPTGNCTFPEYASIALCSTCKDLASLVTGPHPRNDSRFGELRLPTGAAVGFDSQSPWLTVNTTTNMSWVEDFPSHAAWAVHNFTVFTANDGPNITPTRHCRNDNSTCGFAAVACALYPCVRGYSANVSSGIFTETLVSSIPAFPDLFNWTQEGTSPDTPSYPPRPLGPLSTVYTPCTVNGQTYTASNLSSAPDQIPMISFPPSSSPPYTRLSTTAPIHCIHRLDEVYANALSAFLRETLLKGYCMHESSNQGGSMLCRQSFWLDAFFANWTASAESIAAVVEDLALAATNKMRITGKTAAVDNGAGLGMGGGILGDRAEGEVWTVSVCTRIEWRWLVLPAVLGGLGMVVLGMAVVGSWKGPVWKESVLPVVFYGGRFVSREGEVVRDIVEGKPGVMSLAEMEKVADRMEVRFAADREREEGRPRDDADVDSLLIQERDTGT